MAAPRAPPAPAGARGERVRGPFAYAAGSAHAQYAAAALSWGREEGVEGGGGGQLVFPRLDFAPFLRGERGALQSLAAELRGALSTAGFFLMLGHGVDPGPMLAAGRRFHALPAAVKKEYDLLRHPRKVGYAAMGGQHQATTNHRIRNQQQYFRAIVGRHYRAKPMSLDDNNWPAELPELQVAMRRHMQELHALCHACLPVYAAALNSPETELRKLFTLRSEACTVLQYPPMAEAADHYGINPHVDPGFLTLVAQDAPGLVVSSWEGKGEAGLASGQRGRVSAWRRVPFVPGAYVVNTGELAQRLSNDVFKSTRHYVDNPAPGDAPRLSVPFFFHSSPDAQCAPLSGTVSAANPPRYGPLSMNEYYMGKGAASSKNVPKGAKAGEGSSHL